MPLYDYACRACGKTTEILQRFDDPPLEICPHCGGALQKLLSAPTFQFKGSGWYVTDYARKESGGAKQEPAGAGPPSESGDAAKSEAKAADSPATESKASPKTASPKDD